MPSNEESRPTVYPTEVFLGLLVISIIVGIIAWDEIVAIFLFALLTIIYLLYHILRTVELIATKL